MITNNFIYFESSAYKNISELGSSLAQISGRSFMYIKNNKGPNILPRCPSARHVPHRARVLSPARVAGRVRCHSTGPWFAEELVYRQVSRRARQESGADAGEEGTTQWTVEEVRASSDRTAKYHRRDSFPFLTALFRCAEKWSLYGTKVCRKL